MFYLQDKKKLIIITSCILLVILLAIIYITISRNNYKEVQNIEQNTNKISSEVEIQENTEKAQDIANNEQSTIIDNPNTETNKIEISKYISGYTDNFNEEQYLKEHQGYISAKLNENGTLVVEMTSEKQKELTNSLKGGLDAVLKDIVKNQDYPCLKEVIYNENYTELTLIVDKEAYEKDDRGVTNFLISSIGSYQTYAGYGYNITLTVKDISTGEALKTEKYPEILKQREEELKKIIEEHKDDSHDTKKDVDNVDTTTTN